MEKTKEDFWAEFDKLGENGVRVNVNTRTFSGKRLLMASAWLDQKDQERRDREESLRRESNQTARSAKNAAWIAAIAAIIAAISAIIVLLS